MNQICVIGDADTLRWLRRWVTNEHQASVRLLNVTTTGHSANLANGQKPISQPEAAELMQVSPRSVTAARAIHRHGTPELQEAVSDGQIAVSADGGAAA